MVDVEKQLEDARQNLLDLTMRNRLLNFRPTKARTIRIIDEIPSEVYDFLVLQEKTMEFLPAGDEQNLDPDVLQQDLMGELSENDNLNIDKDDASKLWELPSADGEIATRHTDKFLQTPFKSENLQKRLFHTSQQAKSALEEQGYTILYLALGFLEWTESPDSIKHQSAPLLLIPVELERDKIGAAFKLAWTGEDIFANISLQTKLEEQGVLLPDFQMPDEKHGIDSYLQSVTESISKKSDWRVLDKIYLSFFSFTKFVMYKDLDSIAWPDGKKPYNHPLIISLFDPAAQDFKSSFSEDDVDKILDVRDQYHVMDADPSQIAVIEDVKSGRNLVVEGPPGTGKSQTITNIIAELLATGKSVLFVSEKMAALEVVKNRLDDVGMGEFCLELHSRKSNKKEVLKELERTMNKQSRQPESFKDDFDKLESLKRELNGYAAALREPVGKLGQSPFNLFCLKENSMRHFEKTEKPLPVINFQNTNECNQTEWVAAKSALTNLAEALPLVQPISVHPWNGCSPDAVLPSDENLIEEMLDNCKVSINELNVAINELSKICAIQCPTNLNELKHAVSASKVIAVSKPIDRNVLLNNEWNEPNDSALLLIQKVETLQKQLSTINSKFNVNSLKEDIGSILDKYKEASGKSFIYKFVSGNYRSLKRVIAALYDVTPPKDAEQIISDLSELLACIQLKNEIATSHKIGEAFFGSHWNGENSNPHMLESFAKWIVAFRQQLLTKVFDDHVLDVVSNGASTDKIEKSIENVSKTEKQFAEQYEKLVKRLNINSEIVFGTEIETVAFSNLLSRIDLWKRERPKLQRWAQFIVRRKDCLNTIAASIVSEIDSDSLESEDIIPCFEGNFSDSLLRYAFMERPQLLNFIGELHENTIQDFVDIDNQLIIKNRHRLAYKLFKNRPCLLAGASRSSEAGIIQGEFNRKRRHMPIRKLMISAGGLIQKIKPCFMMSPLSIAQFLDPQTVKFDVVVFDEASQVKPEDAFGALLRANQAIVIGDTRQLPPTSFFDKILDSEVDDDDETAPIQDIESILHLCKSSFQTKILRWHYRSKHESLIAVSNQEFYDNQLVIYPSPIENLDHLGLKFIHLPDAIYDRGKSSVNRIEARAVAKAAVEHYKKYPNKSLGVGTFNMKQQQAILEEVELQLRNAPDMEDFFKSTNHEHFFVKNLETIQGDERDVILISIGFGYDQNRKLSKNFGPINRDGGERRLNVLITRAREKCVVFSNFQAKDLSLNANSPFGLKSLKVFLDYAENRNLISMESESIDSDSPFEDSVYELLRSHGYHVQKQVGCAGYRIDLALINPKHPGRYLLGIECDGAKYHSSPVARDRDRLRQQILEKLGWNIYRIWSTDWYRNRAECIQKLLESIEFALSNSENEPEPIDVTTNSYDSSLQITEGDDVNQQDDVDILYVGDRIDEIASDYVLCSSLDVNLHGQLHEQPMGALAEAIIQIANVESPVHIEEVVRRIRTHHGLGRAGKRIKNAIDQAATYAVHSGHVIRRGDFIWSTNDSVQVRCRRGDPPAKIEYICDEEIAEAIKMVLTRQFATPLDDLIVQSSRLFGIQATRGATSKRIKAVIDSLIKTDELQYLSNGMIDLKK